MGDGWDGSSQKLDATVEDVKADLIPAMSWKQVTDLLGRLIPRIILLPVTTELPILPMVLH